MIALRSCVYLICDALKRARKRDPAMHKGNVECFYMFSILKKDLNEYIIKILLFAILKQQINKQRVQFG